MRICAAWLLKHAPPFSTRSCKEGRRFFERAVQLDPNFALAWARLSRATLYFTRSDTAAAATPRCGETCFGECAET